MNIIPASSERIALVRSHLARDGAARLVDDSVKVLRVPGTEFVLTLFIFEKEGKRVFVAECHPPDLPHIYRARRLPPDGDERKAAREMALAIAAVMESIKSDPRFRRNILRVSDATLVRRLNGSKLKN